MTTLITAVTLAGCSTNNSKDIYTTVAPVTEITKLIVKDNYNVHGLIAQGDLPANETLSEEEVDAIGQSAHFIYVDEHLEEWVPELFEIIKPSHSKLSSKLKLENIIIKDLHGNHSHIEENHDGHSHGPEEEPDTALWTSPKRIIAVTESIRDSLIERFPNQKEEFTKNSEEFLSELRKIDKDYENTLSKYKGHLLVSQEYDFGYLAKDYGLESAVLYNLIAEHEKELSSTKNVQNLLKEKKVKTIFIADDEMQMGKNIAHAIDGQAIKLYSFTVADKNTQADYLSLLKNNLINLEKGLSQNG